MAKEIERKFLLNLQKWKPIGKKVFIRQGYLSDDPERIVRVRISEKDGFLTIKDLSQGIIRNEYNYSIPLVDAEELLKLSISTPVEKFRYNVMKEEKLWEVDEFLGENRGLFLAEVELILEDENIDLPEWVGKEVSEDNRYYNSYLSKHPFSKWKIIS
ncbi:MAG: CYTH domain-containing protein [Mariniphaga sp.]|nr:CYTH domain-containing protein [Mariniphaga sp.]